MRSDYRVIGAGPAGLVAAATLAREGRKVRVHERAAGVGHRFAGDIQGLESWSSLTDALERLTALGVGATFDYRPFHEVTFYDPRLNRIAARSAEPLFYLVRRGPEEGSFDRALLNQARDAGAEVLLGQPSRTARRRDIVAIGPRYADGLATGWMFPTQLSDQAHCIVSNQLAPGGYAYLLVWQGRATLATCLFRRLQDWREARRTTVEVFTRLVPGIDPGSGRPFAGYGSVFGAARFTDEAGRLYVGEAAGLQDPEWGFGMWYAMESGALAARSLLEGFDYSAAAQRHFESRRAVAFFNRLVYERLPAPIIAPVLRRGASSTDLRRRIRRHLRPTRLKILVSRVAFDHFARTHLQHRDRACHTTACDCVWCSCGPVDPARRAW